VSRVRALLDSYDYLVGQGSPRTIYLTEGSSWMDGWSTALTDDRQTMFKNQANLLEYNLSQMRQHPDVPFWTLHVVNDNEESDKMYGLREWRNGLDANGQPIAGTPNGPGGKRPSWIKVKNG
jgi:hypothetical protein